METPFSSALAANIVTLIQLRDIEINHLRHKYAVGEVSVELLKEAFERSTATISDQILTLCEATFERLEKTVGTVLEIQAQMRTIREAAAHGINYPGIND